MVFPQPCCLLSIQNLGKFGHNFWNILFIFKLERVYWVPNITCTKENPCHEVVTLKHKLCKQYVMKSFIQSSLLIRIGQLSVTGENRHIYVEVDSTVLLDNIFFKMKFCDVFL